MSLGIFDTFAKKVKNKINKVKNSTYRYVFKGYCEVMFSKTSWEPYCKKFDPLSCEVLSQRSVNKILKSLNFLWLFLEGSANIFLVSGLLEVNDLAYLWKSWEIVNLIHIDPPYCTVQVYMASDRALMKWAMHSRLKIPRWYVTDKRCHTHPLERSVVSRLAGSGIFFRLVRILGPFPSKWRKKLLPVFLIF